MTRPFFPLVWHIVGTLRMLNAFPRDLVDRVPADHARLRDLFDYVPRTLEDDARAHILD